MSFGQLHTGHYQKKKKKVIHASFGLTQKTLQGFSILAHGQPCPGHFTAFLTSCRLEALNKSMLHAGYINTNLTSVPLCMHYKGGQIINSLASPPGT